MIGKEFALYGHNISHIFNPFNGDFLKMPGHQQRWKWLLDRHISITYSIGDCSNTSALAPELLQSCTKPSIWSTSRINIQCSNIFTSKQFSTQRVNISTGLLSPVKWTLERKMLTNSLPRRWSFPSCCHQTCYGRCFPWVPAPAWSSLSPRQPAVPQRWSVPAAPSPPWLTPAAAEHQWSPWR